LVIAGDIAARQVVGCHYFGEQRNIAQEDVPLERFEAEVAAPTDVLSDRHHRPVVGGAHRRRGRFRMLLRCRELSNR
jgi:hypothetical protein